MEIMEFSQKIRTRVERELGSEYQVQLREVHKNNGVVLHGLIIMAKSGNVTPTIYLESFHQAYEKGHTLGEVLRQILDIYREESPAKNIDMGFFRDFDRVKDRICYRLINRERNEELLQTIPYVEFMDLAICFFYAYNGRELGEGSILIHNSHCEMWNVKLKDLMRYAGENTSRLFPGCCRNMLDILRSMGMDLGLDPRHGLKDTVPMKVLTNDKRIQGAACVLYPGILEKISEESRKNLFVLPSSVHEVILLEDTGEENPEDLKRMIYEVNRTNVAAEEVLSDSLYYYDRKQKNLRIIS
ncbi:MAG: DUF5688 family protein [Acetatifactor sp.]